MQTFWIVIADRTELRASNRHVSFEAAREEAERLTRQHGGRFLVFELVGACKPAQPPVDWIPAEQQPEELLKAADAIPPRYVERHSYPDPDPEPGI